MNDTHPHRPPSVADARQRRLADRLTEPFVRWMETEISSALLLLAMAVLALAWANSPFGDSYEHFWKMPLSIQVGSIFLLKLPLEQWVNDALMAIFFFAVGMEIKREMVAGELSTRDKAALPIIAALGGMVAPALIYTAFHYGGPASHGWGVPMATDIAFAVAALSVMGDRVPPGLRVFLLALAIADDLGAVTVIAIFYTSHLNLFALGLAVGGLALCGVANWMGVRNLLIYILIGVFVWYQMLLSGVHATVAGVMLGFLTPTALPEADRETLLDAGRHALERLRELMLGEEREPDFGGHLRAHISRELQAVARHTLSPLDFLVNSLERWVAFFIMPVFALANAGVRLEGGTLAEPMARKVAIAVALGLVFGKPIGITIFSWTAVKLRVASLPRGVNWRALMATGVLAGIGFTVALFVTALAFKDPHQTDGSKIGIICGSVTATVLGLLLLNRALPPSPSRA